MKRRWVIVGAGPFLLGQLLNLAGGGPLSDLLIVVGGVCLAVGLWPVLKGRLGRRIDLETGAPKVDPPAKPPPLPTNARTAREPQEPLG